MGKIEFKPKVVTASVILSAVFLFGVGGNLSTSGSSEDEVKKMIDDTVEAFEDAESKVFKKPVTPDVDGPHPDADKCVCKGTGKITHGDGHTSPCPYHGGKQEPTQTKSSCGCKCDTFDDNGKPLTVCACVKVNGSCKCSKPSTSTKKSYKPSSGGSSGRANNSYKTPSRWQSSKTTRR